MGPIGPPGVLAALLVVGIVMHQWRFWSLTKAVNPDDCSEAIEDLLKKLKEKQTEFGRFGPWNKMEEAANHVNLTALAKLFHCLKGTVNKGDGFTSRELRELVNNDLGPERLLLRAGTVPGIKSYIKLACLGHEWHDLHDSGR